MKQYKSIELTDILYFKQAKFIFKNGITVIRGLNKNSDDLQKNTNGVGKSLLFSCIPNVAYFTAPLAKKNDKKSLFKKIKVDSTNSPVTIGISRKIHCGVSITIG